MSVDIVASPRLAQARQLRAADIAVVPFFPIVDARREVGTSGSDSDKLLPVGGTWRDGRPGPDGIHTPA